MLECQVLRVEEELPILKRFAKGLVRLWVAIDVIQNERIPDGLEMPADLVMPPLRDDCLDERNCFEFLEDFVFRFRRDHLATGTRGERLFDNTLAFTRTTLHECNVRFFHGDAGSTSIWLFFVSSSDSRVAAAQRGNCIQRGFGSCKEHDTGRFEVEAMHGPEPGEILLQKIQQRQLPECTTPAHDQFTAQFVNSEEMLILKEDPFGGNTHTRSVPEELLSIRTRKTGQRFEWRGERSGMHPEIVDMCAKCIAALTLIGFESLQNLLLIRLTTRRLIDRNWISCDDSDIEITVRFYASTSGNQWYYPSMSLSSKI